ncbi:MAG: DUF6394 family protein [Campylobacteraceae bacterium]|jgi:hypothetical protein|nr:DUF6394 family protein [Campylobacteraceae bacterium]
MDWGKVIYVFFALMSLTTTAGFLYEQNEITLFIAMGINLISTFLKIGIKNTLSAELLASSLVADLHLIPAFLILEISGNLNVVIALSIGAIIANLFSLILVIVESARARDEF